MNTWRAMDEKIQWSPLNLHAKCAEKSCELSETKFTSTYLALLNLPNQDAHSEPYIYSCWSMVWKGANKKFICWLGGLRLLLSVIHWLHWGCLEHKPAVYMLVQCTLLLVEKAGAAPDLALRFTACKQVRMQVREPPWLWNPWGAPQKV